MSILDEFTSSSVRLSSRVLRSRAGKVGISAGEASNLAGRPATTAESSGASLAKPRLHCKLLGGVYNYHSTAIRLQFDGVTTIRRPTPRLYAYLCLRADALSALTSCARGDTICLRPLQVDNIFVCIRQVAPVPVCWLFKTSATS